MNIHHLELFYYVARHGGVSAAARKIPYGIQQPAISAQIIQLENNLGLTLFSRRPFKLSGAGVELYAFIEPFFSGIESMGQKLRGGAEKGLRIGALETVQLELLPRLLKAMRRRSPRMHFTLVPGRTSEIENGLLAQTIDLGIAPLLGQRPEGIRQKEMARVPMALTVSESSPLRTARELWRQDRIHEPLITGPGDDVIQHFFQSELQKRKIEWYPSIELGSQELIQRYAAEGFGIGLILMVPGLPVCPGVRVLPLPDFPAIPYGVLWSGLLTPLQELFLEEAQSVAASLLLPVQPPGTARRK